MTQRVVTRRDMTGRALMAKDIAVMVMIERDTTRKATRKMAMIGKGITTVLVTAMVDTTPRHRQTIRRKLPPRPKALRRITRGEPSQRQLNNINWVLGYFTILVRSHIGKKIARAKKPTTVVNKIIKIGPMASASPATAYSTSSS